MAADFEALKYNQFILESKWMFVLNLIKLPRGVPDKFKRSETTACIKEHKAWWGRCQDGGTDFKNICQTFSEPNILVGHTISLFCNVQATGRTGNKRGREAFSALVSLTVAWTCSSTLSKIDNELEYFSLVIIKFLDAEWRTPTCLETAS